MSKTKYILVLIIFTAFVFESCTKQHPDVIREPFTMEQLTWINNHSAPVYKVVSFALNSNDSIITRVNTVKSTTTSYTDLANELVGEDYSEKWYEGIYKTTMIIDYLNVFVSAVLINNRNSFVVSINETETDLQKLTTDTALVDGILYNEVYKISDYGYKHIYFKKGIGFLYLEKYDGSNATLIENTTKPDRSLKPVRFKENNK
jgi:hypothetical protein